MTSPSGFGDDLLHLVDLGLGAADCAELFEKHVSKTIFQREDSMRGKMAYSLLGELAGTLVLGVPQQFDNTALVRSETGNLLDDVADEGSAAGETTLGAADAGLGLDRGGFL